MNFIYYNKKNIVNKLGVRVGNIKFNEIKNQRQNFKV